MDVQASRQLPVLVQETLDEFDKHVLELKERLEDLRAKRELLKAKASGELVTVWMMDSWSTADALSRREEDLAKCKREKNQVDLSIVDVYEKLTMLQLEKVSAVPDKICSIYYKNPHKICILDYTVENIKKQIAKNTQVVSLQSQILELMSKKVRLTQASAEAEETEFVDAKTGLCHVDPRQRFQRLRQRDYAQINAQLTIDKAFADCVHQLLNVNGLSFESLKLKEYIDQCKSGESEDSLASPKNYQSFICALSQYILDKFGLEDCSVDPSVRLDQAYTLVEGVLFPQIEQFIQPFLASFVEKDMQLNERYKTLSHLDQLELGIKEAYTDSRIFPHREAITQITRMNMVSTPTQKLRCILAAAHQTNQFIGSLCSGKTVPGADEFMDVWVYVLLKARLPDFFSTVALLRGYSNPRIGLSEFGYYLASFELAGEYILLQQGDLSLRKSVPSTDSAYTEIFFIPEAERCLKFLENCGSLFEIVQREFCIEGYTLIADLDLQLEPGRLVTTYLVEDNARSVYGTLIRCCKTNKRRSANEWMKAQFEKVSDDVHAMSVGEVIAPVVMKPFVSASSCLKRHIEIPSGKHEDFRILLQRYLSLENLGLVSKDADDVMFETDRLNLKDIESRIEPVKLLLIEGHKRTSADLDEMIAEKVKDIQIRLRLCHMYSALLPIDGIYSSGTRHSVELFQKGHCDPQSTNGEDELRVNGICDSKTHDILCRTSVTSDTSLSL